MLMFFWRRNAGTRPGILEETWREMRRQTKQSRAEPRRRGKDWRREQARERMAQLS
jgi:hypothetical protein